MPNVEMRYPTVSLTTLYFIVKQTGKVFNGTVFETQNSANWSTYKVALSDPQGIGYYQGTVPSGVPVGTVSLYAYLQAGGSPLATDSVIGDELDAYWDGTVLNGIGAAAAQVSTIVAPLFSPSVVAATSSTITLTTADAAVAADALAGSRTAWVSIESGTGALQDRQLTSRVGSTSQFNLSPNWSETPDTTSTYTLYSPDIGTSANVLTQMNAAAVPPGSGDPFTWSVPQMLLMLSARMFGTVVKTVSSDGTTGSIAVKNSGGTAALSTLPLSVSGLTQIQTKGS